MIADAIFLTLPASLDARAFAVTTFVTGDPSTESAYAGLVIAVLALLALFLRGRFAALLVFARYGFTTPGPTVRRAATALLLLGLIPNGFLSLWVRSVNGPVPIIWRTWVNFPAWGCFALAIILYGASEMIDGETKGVTTRDTPKDRERRRKLARNYCVVMVLGIVACVSAFAVFEPFHGPIRVVGPDR